MNIYDMFELIGLDEELVETDYETVGGWCTEILDDFPKDNDTFEFRNLKVTILKVDLSHYRKDYPMFLLCSDYIIGSFFKIDFQ